MKQTALLVSALFSCAPLLLTGCSTGPNPGGNGNPPQKKGDLVDCNYFWPNRNRHVCIKDMPKKECEDMFFVPGFSRDRDCVCDLPGKQKKQLQGTGYVQYDCQ